MTGSEKYSPLINSTLINDTFQAEYFDILKPSNKRKYQGLDESGGKIELKKVRIFCFTFKVFFEGNVISSFLSKFCERVSLALILNQALIQPNLSLLFIQFICQAKIETRALKAKRPGFTDERYNETSYFFENGKIVVESTCIQNSKKYWKIPFDKLDSLFLTK